MRTHESNDMHPLVVFGGCNTRELAKKICSYLDVDLGKAQDKPFKNGESMIRLSDNVRNCDVFVVHSICRSRLATEADPYTGVNDNLMELLIWADTLRRASAYRITAVIPYFGYARQDRKAASRTPITARLVANLLEAAGFDRILTMDLHSDQIQGFFNIPLDHLNAGHIIANHFNELKLQNAKVLSPDIGNNKKSDKYRRGFKPQIDMAIVDKRRDEEGNIVSTALMGDVEGQSIIILDDIISTAGTMRSSIDVAVEHGAKDFYIAATHGEFIGKAVENLSHPLIRQICITDTIPLLPEIERNLGVTVLSVADLFGDAIHRIHTGESISELLGIYG